MARPFDVTRALEALRASGGNLMAASEALGIPEATLRRRLKRAGAWAQVEAIRSGDHSAEVFESEGQVSAAHDPTPVPWKAEDVIRAHGDDPDEVIILRQRGNRWGDPERPMHQLRVDWVRKDAVVRPPDPNDWEPPRPPRPRKLADGEPRKGFVISDHHAPHHDRVFHALVLQRLRDRQPDFIEVNGDLLDFPDISKHRSRDGYNQSVNECLKAGFQILRDYRHVCPDAEITLKRGNHDERLDIHQIDHAPQLRSIAPGGGLTPDGEEDERPWHDLRRLLHLDALHIRYVDEPWEQAKTRPSEKLTLLHGFSTAENAGKQILDRLSGSVIQGHDHRLWMMLRTTHRADGPEVRMAMSAGCAAYIPGGLGYVRGGEPNWQNAAVELLVWPDGNFHATPIIFIRRGEGGQLLCPDRRYEA